MSEALTLIGSQPLSDLLGVRIAGQKGQLMEHVSDQEPVLPFDAWRQLGDGHAEWLPITVTALLERTAAFYGDGGKYDTGVMRLDKVFVDPALIEWKSKSGTGAGDKRPGQNWRNYRTNAKPVSEARAASDERALKDQATKHQEEPMSTHATKPKPFRRCPSCRIEKPRDQFPTGRGAKACLDCQADRKAGIGKPLPIKRSIAGKKARKAAPLEVVSTQPTGPTALAGGIPTESLPTVVVLDHVTRTSVEGLPNGDLQIKVRKGPGDYSDVLATSPGGDHYRTMAIEPIQYIEANGLPFHEANVVKYVSRWKLKNGLEDLRKARFYIDRLIELEEAKPVA